MNLFLIAYGVILAALGFRVYKNSIKKIRASFDSQLAGNYDKKRKLLDEIRREDDRILDLHSRETMMVNLYEITKKMSHKLTFDEMFQTLGDVLKENFSFIKSELLILKNEDGNTKVDKTYKLYKNDDHKDDKVNPDYAGLLGIFTKDKKEIYELRDDISFGAIPLLSENKFVGILTVEGLSRMDFEKFVIVATQFALEIKKVLLYETVEALAIRDGLTGLYTRRYLFERLNEELNRSKRQDLKFAFLMIDIDDFKLCNDAHGHLVGDIVLKDVARIIKENIREIDLAARFGGEEFSVILPETEQKGAYLAAERIRKKIDENVFKAYDEKLKITVSAGVSIYQDYSKGPEDIVEKADRALYKAKTSGKNIVCEYKD